MAAVIAKNTFVNVVDTTTRVIRRSKTDSLQWRSSVESDLTTLSYDCCPREMFSSSSICSQPRRVSSCASTADSQDSDSSTSPTPVTLLIRNIPNRKRQAQLLTLFNEHGFQGLYDMFLLPCSDDGANLGYAFLRFRDSEDGERFIAAFSRKCLTVGSKKRLSITYAANQGSRKFKASRANSASKPVYFNKTGMALGQRKA